MNAQTTASGKKKPSAFPALIPAMRTFGATPTMRYRSSPRRWFPLCGFHDRCHRSRQQGPGLEHHRCRTRCWQNRRWSEIRMRVVESTVNIANED